MSNYKFVAHCQVGAGGSWAKGETPEHTAERLKQIITEDWGGTFNLKGQSTEVSIYSIPEEENWSLTAAGLSTEDGYADPVEIIEISF